MEDRTYIHHEGDALSPLGSAGVRSVLVRSIPSELNRIFLSGKEILAAQSTVKGLRGCSRRNAFYASYSDT